MCKCRGRTSAPLIQPPQQEGLFVNATVKETVVYEGKVTKTKYGLIRKNTNVRMSVADIAGDRDKFINPETGSKFLVNNGRVNMEGLKIT